ncbi:unnamed protein product [Paramecium pentaurelia]|uniref:Transmembrane protein n=1 Tax=Paramecium pentaurelia TaxID=43138 RepID=A0A8S1XW35_9CILI|nr:unnamed protein product [Paramecium pentaurelia]
MVFAIQFSVMGQDNKKNNVMMRVKYYLMNALIVNFDVISIMLIFLKEFFMNVLTILQIDQRGSGIKSYMNNVMMAILLMVTIEVDYMYQEKTYSTLNANTLNPITRQSNSQIKLIINIILKFHSLQQSFFFRYTRIFLDYSIDESHNEDYQIKLEQNYEKKQLIRFQNLNFRYKLNSKFLLIIILFSLIIFLTYI